VSTTQLPQHQHESASGTKRWPDTNITLEVKITAYSLKISQKGVKATASNKYKLAWSSNSQPGKTEDILRIKTTAL